MTTGPDSMPPLYGLVMAGGMSSRMGRDKAALAYAGKPQVRICAELLAQFAERVFVSGGVREDDPLFSGMDVIEDEPPQVGPMGGLSAAQNAHPGAAWLVLACDLPLVDSTLLHALVDGRDPSRRATAFMAGDGLFEPLCAIYEPEMRPVLHERIAGSDYSLRRALGDSNVRLLCAANEDQLRSVNTPEEYAVVMAGLSHGKGTST